MASREILVAVTVSLSRGERFPSMRESQKSEILDIENGISLFMHQGVHFNDEIIEIAVDSFRRSRGHRV